MKKQITIIGQTNGERMNDISTFAKTFTKADVQVISFDTLTLSEIPELVKKIKGTVLYMGFARMEPKVRTALRKKIMKHHVLINGITTKNKKIKSKYGQQMMVKKANLLGIPSYSFKKFENLKEKIEKHSVLHYPFILKKNISSQGKDVHIIRKFSDLKKYTNIGDYVFQPYIENKGDFRVFVVGNKVLGVILRTGAIGEFRNNISQGGTARNFLGKKMLQEIHPLAKKLVKLFECDYAGVDLIYDTTAKKLRFMEMNFMPQWNGFTSATKVNVPLELLTYACKR